jgi:hypothetical protein
MCPVGAGLNFDDNPFAPEKPEQDPAKQKCAGMTEQYSRTCAERS